MKRLADIPYQRLQDMLLPTWGKRDEHYRQALAMPTRDLLVYVEYCRRNMQPRPVTYEDGIANELLPELIRRVEDALALGANLERAKETNKPRRYTSSRGFR